MHHYAIAPTLREGMCCLIFNVQHHLPICFQEDLSEPVVQGDAHPGHVGTACLLSSSFLESGKDIGLVTLPIMGRNSRQTIGKVKGKLRLSTGFCRRQVSVTHTHWNLCLSSLSQWTTWWSGPSRGCSATWAHPTPSTGRREAPSTLVTEEPAAPMQPSKSTTCT